MMLAVMYTASRWATAPPSDSPAIVILLPVDRQSAPCTAVRCLHLRKLSDVTDTNIDEGVSSNLPLSEHASDWVLHTKSMGSPRLQPSDLVIDLWPQRGQVLGEPRMRPAVNARVFLLCQDYAIMERCSALSSHGTQRRGGYVRITQ
jgi:hypothetical protein